MHTIKTGNYYEFFNPEKETLTIGKVLSHDHEIANYAIYYSCADYFGNNLKPHHSQYELIRSDDPDKEFITNVKRQVKVLRANEFRKLDDRDNTYFFR